MDSAVIIDAVRSPMGRGREGGSLSGLHAVELLSQTIRGLIDRTGLDPASVDDVLIGCVSQAGEQSATPGRMAWLAAGYPAHVPAVTIDRRCGSSQQAIAFAAQGVAAGAYEIAVAGGVEVMSRVPMGSARLGEDPHGPSVAARYAPGLVSQGVAAELVAQRFGITRSDMDEYAERSHTRAASAAASDFDGEIIGVDTGSGTLVTKDETIRPMTTVERLAGLKPAFESDAHRGRFPDIEWGVTAGNSSQISDGASAVMVMSERLARELGLAPIARIVDCVAVGDDPVLMLTGPIPATRKILKRTGLSIDDIDHFEVNEAFASVPLAWQREFGVADEVLNPVGGAIALGHPLGASGGRLFTSMIHQMRRRGQRYGLQTMCEAGGMANATIIEIL